MTHPLAPRPHGLFITFEGGEGSGKSTQSKLLHGRLLEILTPRGIDVVWTREPGGSKGAEEIRDLLVKGDANRWTGEAEALLMFAARDDHWKNHIEPTLSKGTWVICDRFADSSFAYQGYGKGVPLPFLHQLYAHTVGVRKPDRTYLLDMPVDIGLERSKKRLQNMVNPEDRFEGLGQDFHARVQHGFQNCAKAEPNRFCVIDATQSVEAIAQLLWEDIQVWLTQLSTEGENV